MTKVSDDLKAARARLAVPGVWAQGCGTEDLPEKGKCAYTVTWGLENVERVQEALAEVVEADDEFAFYKWHDAPGRTLDEVLAVYDKAIAIAEKKEADEART